jgi:hypothetical protein
MCAQTFLLPLTAHGFAGVPQTLLGLFAAPIWAHPGVPDEMKLLFGISFGYAIWPASRRKDFARRLTDCGQSG